MQIVFSFLFFTLLVGCGFVLGVWYADRNPITVTVIWEDDIAVADAVEQELAKEIK